MRYSKLSNIAAIATLLAATPAFAAVSYTVTDLGPFGAFPIAINDSGQVAMSPPAQLVPLDPLNTHATLYSNGSTIDFGTLGGPTSAAYDVNNAGQIAGSSELADGSTHAVIGSNGTLTDISGPLGGPSIAYGINNLGQVVGHGFLNGSSFHAFLYSAGVAEDLGTLGGTESSAQAINDAGTVTGYAYLAGNKTFHAFQYANGIMTDLGTLGGPTSTGFAINSSGQIVGSADTPQVNSAGINLQHAFVYSNNVLTDLGTLGGSNSDAYGINDAGDIVGSSRISNNSLAAFIYSDGTIINLNTLISPAFGWNLIEAFDINNAGQIVGYGGGPNGLDYFLLTPTPEPTSLLILTLAAPLILRRPRIQ